MTAPSYVHTDAGLGSALQYAADRFLNRGSSGAVLRSASLGLGILVYWFGLSFALAPSVSVLPAWLAGLPFPADALARVLASLFAPACGWEHDGGLHAGAAGLPAVQARGLLRWLWSAPWDR